MKRISNSQIRASNALGALSALQAFTARLLYGPATARPVAGAPHLGDATSPAVRSPARATLGLGLTPRSDGAIAAMGRLSTESGDRAPVGYGRTRLDR